MCREKEYFLRIIQFYENIYSSVLILLFFHDYNSMEKE